MPPLWKRFVAEFLDFFFLFITKVIFTFIAVDYFDLMWVFIFSILNTVKFPMNMNSTFSNLDKYSVFSTKTTTLHLLKQITEDYDFAFEVTSEIFILEIINRLGACFYEVIIMFDFFDSFIFYYIKYVCFL